VYTIGTQSAWTKVLAAWMGLSYVAFTFWWIALSYLAFPRVLFAWGMGPLGPKWFTDINPRFASPVKNHILCFVIGEGLLVAYYALADQRPAEPPSSQGMQITSVFIPTAFAALVFPYVKRAKASGNSSPYKTWKFLGLARRGFGGRQSTLPMRSSCSTSSSSNEAASQGSPARLSSCSSESGERAWPGISSGDAQQGGGRRCGHDLRVSCGLSEPERDADPGHEREATGGLPALRPSPLQRAMRSLGRAASRQRDGEAL